MSTKNIGTGMLYVSWVLILAMLAYFFGNWEEDKINPNRKITGTEINGIREIVLERNRYDHYVLNAEINGVSIAFLVDTGATHLVFTEAQALQAGLKKGLPFWVSTANGDIQVFDTTVSHMQMGNIELQGLAASINPHMDGHALLGMSALVDLEWTQKGERLIIRQ